MLTTTAGVQAAFTGNFLQTPTLANFLESVIDIEDWNIRRNDFNGGYPVLRIWFENDHGKVKSSLYLDVAGHDALPSLAFRENQWPKALPDIQWTIIGVLPRERQAPAVPIPGAVWLFGSGLVGLVMLGRKRLRGETKGD
ncbi:hypothetical protein CKO23_14520 [Thiocystis violacea]|nr:hypothetical protein [Thiocystis violacea]